jgi:hypothetical protein
MVKFHVYCLDKRSWLKPNGELTTTFAEAETWDRYVDASAVANKRPDSPKLMVVTSGAREP